MTIIRRGCTPAQACSHHVRAHHTPGTAARLSFDPVRLVLAGLFLLSGCAGLSPIENPIEPRPLGRALTPDRFPVDPDKALSVTSARPDQQAAPTPGGAGPADLPPPTGSLTLREALAAALLNNPELAAFSWQVRAAEARALQASLRPNPELGVEVENFGGSDVYSGFDTAEITAMISQKILTGGEIDKRTRVARLERKLKAWSYEAKRLDVFTQVVKRYVEVLAAQRKLAVTEEAFKLAQQFYQTVSRQVAAGAVSPIRETRAAAERARERVDLRRAERALQQARIALAETLGLAEPSFEKVIGDLEGVEPIPALEVLHRFIDQNPAIARWDTVLAKRKAAVELAEAEGIPDVTVGVGVRRFRRPQGPDATAAVASLSVPLPIFDRNQGNIAAARAELMAARKQRQSAIVRVRTALGQGYQELAAAREAVLGLAQQALPAARSAYQAVLEAYQYGQRGFLDVLVARRTLFQVKTSHVEALAEYHRTKAAVERLIVRPIDGITTNGATSHEAGAPTQQGDTP